MRLKNLSERFLERLHQVRTAKVSWRFLGSYLLILIIPLVIFIYVLNNIYLQKLEQQVEEDNLYLARTISQNLNNSLEGMRNIAHQISRSAELTTYYLTDSPLNAKAGITQMANFIYGQNLIADIALVCANSDYIYTSQYAPKTADFLASIKADLAADQLYERLFSDFGAFYPIIRYVDSVPVAQVLYILQDESSSSVNQRAVLIFISQIKLNNLIAASDSFAALYDSNGQVIAARGDGQPMTPGEIAAVFQSGDRGDHYATQRIPGESFISAYQYPIYQATLVITRSWEATMGDISAMQARSFLILALVFAAGLIMIFFDMRMLYLPILRLKKYAESALGTGDKTGDEFEVLDQALQHFLQETHTMSEKLKSSQDLFRERYVQSLLLGTTSRLGLLEQAEREGGLNFPGESFCAVVLLPAGSRDIDHMELILAAIKNLPAGSVNIAGTAISQSGMIGLILNFDPPQEASIRDFMQHLATSITASLDCRFTVGVGNVCSKRADIGRSFIEARTSLDYRLIFGIGKIIFWNDIRQNQDADSAYPYEQIRKLEIMLLDANMEAVAGIVDQLIGQVKSGSLSLGGARCLAYDLINTILRVINVSGAPGANVASAAEASQAAMLADFETLDDLAAAIKVAADRLCGMISANKTRYNDGLLGNIRRYIGENYLDYNFTVKMLASEFGMSESNISHYYKNATGHNLSDYINDLRIGKAKDLLVSTDLSVRDIVQQIGYCDVSSFTRKFRLIIGLSPGNYRQTVGKREQG